VGGVGSSQWQLVYRGSRDGFGANHFHSKCDGKRHLLVVVRCTNGNVFGGYTADLSFTSSGDDVEGSGTWLFTLKNPHGIPPTLYPVVQTEYALRDYSGYGPTFGSNDLYISNDCNTNTESYSYFPDSYKDTTEWGNETFAGGWDFQVSEIEVFQTRVWD